MNSTFFSLILLWLAHFLVDFMIGIWAVFKTISGLDLGLAGLIAASCGFIGEGSQLIFGPMTDRGFKKRLIMIGLALTAASALLANANSYWVFFLLYLCTCIGSGAFHPPAVAYIGGLTEKRKSLFIAIFTTGGSLGLACSQLVFTTTHSYFEGHTLVLLVPSFLLASYCLFAGFGGREQLLEKKEPPRFGLSMFRDYFKNRSLRVLYLTQVSNQTIAWATLFILPDILVSRGYEENIAFGGGHLVYILGGVLMMIPSGLIADRYSSRKVILVASGVGAVLFYTFLLLPSLPVTYLLPVLAMMGATLGTIQPVAVAMGNRIGRSNPGLVSAFTMGLVWCVSESAGPGGVGILTHFFDTDAPGKALMVMGALFPGLILAAYYLPEEAKDDVKAMELIDA